MNFLADGNLLIAFSWDGHVHHARAKHFFSKHQKTATCPITELNLVESKKVHKPAPTSNG
ncbi:MAG: hypothetical protein H0X66_08820 [Verrucomicrobia bacterium]|nr:hypothetical protein [Verrucomicrobiota bacterium]